MKYIQNSSIILLLIQLCLLASGCSTTTDELAALKPVELGASLSVDTPEAELIRDAQRFYENRLFNNAQTAFEQIRDGYPFGPYAEYAEVKVADCHFYTYDYLTASLLYSDFVKQHTTSPNVPYALVQLGRSYLLQYTGHGRDLEPLQKARDTFADLLKRYPNTIYTGATKKYLAKAEKKIIEHEKLIAAFYKRMGQEKASLARAQRADTLKVTFQSEIDSLPAPQTGGPGSVEVPKLVRTQTPPKTGSGQKAALTSLTASGSSIQVLRVNCIPENDQITLFLSKTLTPEQLSAAEKGISVKAGQLITKISNASANQSQIDCFTEKDLTLESDGTIKLKTAKSAVIFGLDKPSRMVIALE